MKTHPQSGLTLLEVVMAMFLLSLALLGLAAAFPPAHLAVFQGRVSTRAMALAEQRIEVARSTPYSNLPTLAGTDTTTAPPYTVVTTVTQDAPTAGLTSVQVTVTGPDIMGPNTQPMGASQVVLETFFAQADALDDEEDEDD